MRRLRLRFSVRTMMVVVAILAAGLGYVHHRRSATFRRRADANARQAAAQADRVKQSRKTWEEMDGRLGYGAAYLAWRERSWTGGAPSMETLVDFLKQDLDRNRALLAYYEGLEKKYRRAATSPWLPVAPDPLPPTAGARPVSATADRRAEVPEGSLGIVASLPKGVFDYSDHPLFGRAIPLTIEYRNRSDRPIAICPISHVVVTDVDGNETTLTGQGQSYRQDTSSPAGETRRKHSSIVIEPGRSFLDSGLDLTGLYRLPPGRYSVQVFHNDLSPPVSSAPVPFWVRRVRSGR